MPYASTLFRSPPEHRLQLSCLGQRPVFNRRDPAAGFAAEVRAFEMDADDATKNASAMIDTKEVDAVCLNLLKDSSSFGTADNQIDFITAHGIESLPKMDKLSLSFAILDKAAAL